MHILHVFGWTGVKRGYLDVPLEVARARYETEEGPLDGVPYEAIVFADSLSLYSASSFDTVTISDRVEALAATEVRADITAIATTLGIHAAFTDLGRRLGNLFQALPNEPKRRRAAPSERAQWQLLVVTARLAAALAEQGAPVAQHDGIHLWLRADVSPLREDRTLARLVAER